MNCDTEVRGRFCHVCGQENIEPTETVWGLVSHFFYDITHFDGKFFTSLKWLIRKPGFLSKEYISGRRARHLNPIRMYVFTSAFFFILFFTFFLDVKNMAIENSVEIADQSSGKMDSVKQAAQLALKEAKTKEDSIKVMKKINLVELLTDTTSTKFSKKKKNEEGSFDLFMGKDEYQTISQYDSVQNSLSSEKRDGWLIRTVIKREILINQKIKKEGASTVFKEWINIFTHSFPQILFISLPLVAFILYLLYIRRRKRFYYVNHGIFLIHIYIYSFINLLFYFLIQKLSDATGWGWLGFFQFALFLHAAWYVYKAMRNFYEQRRFKTIVKFLLLNLLTFIVIDILFIGFFLFSALQL